LLQGTKITGSKKPAGLQLRCCEQLCCEQLSTPTTGENVETTDQEQSRGGRPEGRDWTNYLVGRLRFAVLYLDAVEAFGVTARAEKTGNLSDARRHAEIAYQKIRQALEANVTIAKDHGDLGAVALMNKFCYRPIRQKQNELHAE